MLTAPPETSRSVKSLFKTNQIEIAVLIILTLVLFSALLSAMLKGSTDYPAHLELAEALSSGKQPELFRTHILFHVFTIFISRFGIDIPTSGYIVSLMSYVITAVILFFWLNPVVTQYAQSRWRTSAYVIALMVIAPIIFTWSYGPHYLNYNYIPINVQHNPTLIIVKPLAVLLFLYLIYTYQIDQVKNGWVVMGAALTILNALAKPNYLLCLLPALLIITFMRYRRRQSLRINVLLPGIIIPASIVLGLQFGLMYQTGSESGIAFMPLGFQWLGTPSLTMIAAEFFMSILFPVCVYLACWHKTRKDFTLNSAWLIFAIGALQNYVLVETAPRLGHGNWTWGAQIAIFILFAASLRTLIKYQRSIRKPYRHLCWIVFTLHLLCGVTVVIIRFL